MVKVSGRDVFRDGRLVARIGGGRTSYPYPQANFGIRLLNNDGSAGKYLPLPGYAFFRDVVRDIAYLLDTAEESG